MPSKQVRLSAADSPAAPKFAATKGKELTRIAGAVGTFIYDGFITDLREADSKFRVNARAFRIFEQMYRTDPQVYATVQAHSLPIRGARWTVEPPPQATSIEKEAAELVKENLFGGLEYTSPSGLTVSQHWDDVISHALLMLRYGAAAAEEIYRIDGDRVSLGQLMPLMPDTYYRWHVDQDGMTLMYLEQLAFRGSSLDFWMVPADKICLFTHHKEGAYFPGRSLFRAMYQPWFFKHKLEIVEAIAGERNGMGIPVGIHAENPATEDRRLLNKWVTQIATHQALGVGLPHGADLKLVGVSGRLYPIQDAITRYAQEITRVGLVDFLNLGTGSSGSRAVGDVLEEFFYTNLQANAEAIARSISSGPVRRIVDFNFPGKFGRASGGRLRYPAVAAANVKSRSLLAVMQFIDKLADANIIRPDDDFEAYVRRELGAPEADPKTARLVKQGSVRVTDQTQGDPAAPTPAAGPAAAAPQKKQPNAQAADEPTTEQDNADNAQVEREAGEETAQLSAVRASRQPRGVEQHVSVDDVAGALDRCKESVAALVRKSTKAMIAAAAQKAVSAPIAKVHQVSLPLDRGLALKVRGLLAEVYAVGRNGVEAERSAQRKGAPPQAPQSEPSVIHAAATGSIGADKLQLLADTTVAQVQNQIAARVADATLKAKANGGAANPAQVALDVDEQNDGYIDRAASSAANNAIANGRQDGFAEHRDEIDRFIYSAMLDSNTCGECSDADGKEGQEGDIPDVPNPNCEGGDQCRCMWVAVFKDEGGAA